MEHSKVVVLWLLSFHVLFRIPPTKSTESPEISGKSGKERNSRSQPFPSTIEGLRFRCLLTQRSWYRMENGPKWGKKWPKNGEKIGIWGHFSISSPFLGHFFPFRAEGHFLIFGQFFPTFLDFGPFSILYQAARLVKSVVDMAVFPVVWGEDCSSCAQAINICIFHRKETAPDCQSGSPRNLGSP